MNSILKKALLAVGALVALAAASGGGFRWWLEGKLSKEAVVAQMESSWNCRAQIDSITLVLMSNPARLEILGTKIAARDAEVSKPLAQRAPIPEGKADFSIARAVLEVKLQDLVARRLNIQQLLLSDISVKEDVPKEGDSSLALLFSKPDATAPPDAAVAGAASPAPPAEAVAQLPVEKAPEPFPMKEPPPAAAPLETAGAKQEARGFVAQQLGFSIQVRNASLERVSFKRSDHRSASKTDITDLTFAITDIDVDPADLAHHNSVRLALNGRLKQRGRIGPKEDRREVTLAEVVLDGEGVLHPFDAATGLYQPVSNLRLTLKKDSLLGGYMKLGETGSKDLKKLDDYGLDLRDISMGGPLLEDAVIRMSFQDDRITLQEDARFSMPDFELALQQESWLNGAEDQHEMQVRITCGPKLQEQLILGAEKAVGKDLAASLLKSLSDEKGRVYFDMLSTGRLTKPNVKPDLQRLLGRLLQSLGTGGLLEGLLNRK